MKMRSIALALCFLAATPGAQAAMDTEELTEKVLSFSAQGDQVKVICAQSAQPLRLAAARPDFVKLMGHLAAAWKAKKPVTLTVKSGEIVNIAAP